MAWLGFGARGDLVKNIQGILYQAGLYQGSIDGRFGPKTERALKSWQSELGVVSDGYWGPKTLKATSDLLSELNKDANPAGTPVIPYYGKARYE